MATIKEHLRDKHPDYIEGFLNGVKLFAHWKDGIEYVGTCGKMYSEVLTSANELLQEAEVSKKKHGGCWPETKTEG